MSERLKEFDDEVRQQKRKEKVQSLLGFGFSVEERMLSFESSVRSEGKAVPTKREERKVRPTEQLFNEGQEEL